MGCCYRHFRLSSQSGRSFFKDFGWSYEAIIHLFQRLVFMMILTNLHIDENSPLARLKDHSNNEEITDETYGPFKASCEKVIKTYFPDNSLIIRPGLIVGPYDSSDRFTYWVRRIAEGGKVLIPNNPKQKLQIIDVRDLAKWIVKMVEEQAVGTYNATGPREELSFEKFINECSQFAKKKVDFVWVDEQFFN